MKTEPTPQQSNPTRELVRAFEASGLTQAAVAKHLEVSAAQLRQWLVGFRPVPGHKAEALGALLDVDPALISPKYRKYAEARRVAPGSEGASAGARPDDSIRAAEFAIAALASAMVSHRPAEALAVAEAIRHGVPTRYREHGLLKELLATLDKAARPT